MQLQTDHIAEQDGKIERLNNQVNEYLSRYFANHVSVCMSDYPVTVCCLIGDHRPCVLLDKEPDEYGVVRQKKKLEEQRDQLISLSNNWKRRPIPNWFSLRMSLMISVLHYFGCRSGGTTFGR